MKKVISLLTILAMLLVSTFTTFAAEANENVIHTLAGYGIIDADAPTDIQITRGEFAHIVVKLLGYTSNDASAEAHYWDVPADYKYASDISLLTQIGILNGVSENLFAPDDFLTYEQAVKVMVVITGYGDIANQNGGWIGGYITAASRNSMLGGVSLQNPFSRADLYRLIYNTLDVKLINEKISSGSGSELVKSEETLRDRLANTTEYQIYKHRGVIVANSFSYITSPYSDLYDDEVVIDNHTEGKSFIYRIGKTNAYNMVGQEVEFYFKSTEDGAYELLSVKPTFNNEVIDVTAQNLGSKNGNSISYEKENGKNEKLDLDTELKVVYNGTRVLSYGDDIFNLTDGSVTFINNDSDAAFEVAMVWEYQNAIAEKFDGQRFDFKASARYNGLNALFVDAEDKSIKMDVFDKDGKRVESFDAPHTVSISANNDRNRYRVIVSDDVVEGVFESYGDDIMTVSGTDYTASASLDTNLALGENYLFFVNYEGKLAFFEDKDVVNYAYILQYGSGNGSSLAGKVSAKLILPGKVDDGVVVNEEDVTDTSRVPFLILQNEGTKIFDFADSIRCQGSKYTGKEILGLLSQDNMKAISYELNENGEIAEITPLEKVGGDFSDRYQYNVYDRVFGGTMVDQTSGFAINNLTKAACVPIDSSNNIITDASDDDMMLKVNITVANNDVGYRVEGYDFDKSTKKAKFLVAMANMEADFVPGNNAFQSTVSMVTDVRFVVNSETGETEQEIEILKGGSTIKLQPIAISADNKRIETLKKGDLITYLTNNNDALQNVFVFASIPTVSKEVVSSTNVYAKSFGTAGKIEFDEIDTYSRTLVTKLEFFVNGELSHTYSIPQTNKPPVYIYNKADRSITTGSLADIRPEAEKLYIVERSGDGAVRGIVLVR